MGNSDDPKSTDGTSTIIVPSDCRVESCSSNDDHSDGAKQLHSTTDDSQNIPEQLHSSENKIENIKEIGREIENLREKIDKSIEQCDQEKSKCRQKVMDQQNKIFYKQYIILTCKNMKEIKEQHERAYANLLEKLEQYQEIATDQRNKYNDLLVKYEQNIKTTANHATQQKQNSDNYIQKQLNSSKEYRNTSKQIVSIKAKKLQARRTKREGYVLVYSLRKLEEHNEALLRQVNQLLISMNKNTSKSKRIEKEKRNRKIERLRMGISFDWEYQIYRDKMEIERLQDQISKIRMQK
jgi:chromosome segregation ATPase